MQDVVLTFCCTSTALLNPENTIDVHSLLWCILLHPGAAQSSGLSRLHADVWDEIDIALNRELYEKYFGSMDNMHRDRAEPTPRKPAPMSSTLSSGPIEGVGLQAAEPQDMGLACWLPRTRPQVPPSHE